MALVIWAFCQTHLWQLQNCNWNSLQRIAGNPSAFCVAFANAQQSISPIRKWRMAREALTPKNGKMLLMKQNPFDLKFKQSTNIMRFQMRSRSRVTVSLVGNREPLLSKTESKFMRKLSSAHRIEECYFRLKFALMRPPLLHWVVKGGGFHFCDMRMGVVAARTSKCQIKYSTTICVSIRCHCLYFMAFAHGIACCAANAWGGGGASERTGDWEVWASA